MTARARRPYRPLVDPFVVAPPAGAWIRTRLRPSVEDEQVLRKIGAYLGGLAGHDLAERCRIGNAPDERTRRKRELTALSSSRWAGAITRTSDDQWERAGATSTTSRPACGGRLGRSPGAART